MDANRFARVAVFAALLIIFFSSAFALEFREAFVQDYALVIDPAAKSAIESQLRAIYDSGKAEVAVVTIDSLEGASLEKYAFDLVEGKLGDEKKNNGLLLLIAVQDRQYRFEVGRGIEPIFNDAKVGRMGRNYLVPAFQANDYGTGILLVVQEVSQELGVELSSQPLAVPVQQEFSIFQLAGPIMFLVFFIVPMFVGVAKNKRRGDKYFMAALIAANLMGGRGGRGGFGGGFGGFGGGSFGGGGASGGW